MLEYQTSQKNELAYILFHSIGQCDFALLSAKLRIITYVKYLMF
jgi:hypothetical protein